VALFVAFEGLDGSGKTTQARALFRRLQRLQIAVVLTHEPGGTPLGQSLRRLLKRGPTISSMSELLLFVAARSQLVQDVLRPAIDEGNVVIADRFSGSTVAYQGYGRGLDLELINRVDRDATAGLTPDLTVLVDLPEEIALRRKDPLTNDTFDTAPMEFHRRVRQGYLDQAAQHPEGWVVLDGTRSQRELTRQVWDKVQPLL
jgi:dTMP kinase